MCGRLRCLHFDLIHLRCNYLCSQVVKAPVLPVSQILTFVLGLAQFKVDLLLRQQSLRVSLYGNIRIEMRNAIKNNHRRYICEKLGAECRVIMLPQCSCAWSVIGTHNQHKYKVIRQANLVFNAYVVERGSRRNSSELFSQTSLVRWGLKIRGMRWLQDAILDDGLVVSYYWGTTRHCSSEPLP